ncbi:MAG: PAS domain-containing protein [Gammaproteobacteria bacterium]|nr:PAS domain-containing protein [Gammaproteobacteria bacterium]
MQRLIDSIPDLIFYKDLQGCYLGCNKAFEDFVGSGYSSIVGKSDLDLFPRDVAVLFRERDQRMLAAGNALKNEEWVEYPDGRRVLLDTRRTPYFSTDGELRGLIGVSRDITESHASHEKLAYSLSLQLATLESSADGILVVNNNGKWQSFNRKFLEMWRIPESISSSGDDQLAIGFVLEQLKYPDAFVKRLKELQATPEASSRDEVLFKDGRTFERLSVPQVLDGRTVGRVWSFRDIAERKQTELLVNRHSQILEMIASGQPAAGIYDAIALMYEARHPGMRCSLLELKDGKLIHGGAPSLPEEYCEAVNGLKNGPNVGSCGTSTYTGQRVLVEDIASDPKWAEIKAAALPHGLRCCWSEPIKDSKGKVMGAFGMYYNHTALPDEEELSDLESAARLAGIVMERDQREIALRQSERKYRTLVENLPQRLFLKNRDSVYVSCNINFAADLGTTPERIAGTNDNDHFPIEIAARFRQDDRRILRSGVAEMLEEPTIIAGEERIVHTHKAPVFDENGNAEGVLGIYWDVTEQKLLEEKYLQAQKMESVGTLVGGVAHEFNNTLAGITGRLFLAQADAADNPKVLQHLDAISTQSFRAAEMIQQLLAFSRKSSIQLKSFDLAEFVKEIIGLHKFSIPENIGFESHLTSSELSICGDSTQIQQILQNLLNNARDAVRDEIDPRISLRLERLDVDDAFVNSHPRLKSRRFAHMIVEDNGCGISKENRKKIFDPFFTTKAIGKGTGLGLAMVYGAVQTHGGVVEVDSGRDNGTRMHVYLPLTSSSSDSQETPADSLAQGSGEHILFVDDEAELRILGREVLESLGYSVLEASNGVDAIDTYVENQEKISLVVMDVVMPELGGVEAALAIRALNRTAKIIFCTGYDGKSVIDRNVTNWAEVISKPYRITEFSQIIQRTLAD